MTGEHEPEIAVERDDARRKADVLKAVELFIEQHSTGQVRDAMAFAQQYDESMRGEILIQCREYLSFDGLLGHQEWQGDRSEVVDGRQFGDFLIQDELGRGGMGVVYLAHQQSLGRQVALKVMASGLTLSKRHVERFRREAMATAKLRHPAIVPVHSLTEVDGTFALAMDYIAGRNLADVIDDLRLANRDGEGVSVGTLGIAKEKGYVAECAMLAAEVASALAAAHQNQVVHRDLKPRNLMIDDHRQVRLLDFGLAKSLDATRESISMSGEITGTAHYMSPEQTLAKRVEVDHRADIWSLGVILYELLTLQRPFEGKNLQQIVYEICFKEPVPLQKRNPKVPRDLVTICQKALEKDPQNRYQTAAEFEADLQRFLSFEPIHAKPASAWTRASKFVRRHRMQSAFAAAFLVVATTVVSVLWYRAALDNQRADDLLERAETRAEVGDFPQAILLTNRALALRNDAITRERLGRYHEGNKRVENEALRKVAESKRLLDHDREGALKLAIEAEQLASSPITRSAVLDTLGSGWATRTLPTPEGQVTLLASWSPSGQHIATAGYGGGVRYFDSDRQERPLDLIGHATALPVVGLTFLDERRLVTASPDATLRMWQPGSTVEPRTISLGTLSASTLLASDDGSRVLVTCYNRIDRIYQAQVWDTASWQRIGKPVEHGTYILEAALRGDGEVAATSSGVLSPVKLWRTDDGSPIAELDQHTGTGSVHVLQFSPDGTLLSVGCSDGFVRVYDAGDGSLLATVKHSRAITSIAFDQSGKHMLTGSREHTARLWQLVRGPDGLLVDETSVLVGHDGPVQHVAFDRDGKLMATATGVTDHTIRIFDVGSRSEAGNEAIHRYEAGESIEKVMFAGDGNRILAIGSRRTMIWNFGSARGMVALRQWGQVPGVAFLGDGETVITAGDDEKLRTWHARDGRQVHTSEPLGNPIESLDVDRDSQRLACSVVGGDVHVRRIDDRGQRIVLRDPGYEITTVAFVDDDTVLAAGHRPAQQRDRAATGYAALWNIAAGEKLATLERPHPIVAADVDADGAADGALLVTAERGERVARLWSLPSFAPVAIDAGHGTGTIAEHGARILSVRFAADGRSLITGSRDRTARIHALDGTTLQTFGSNAEVRFATISPDGSMALTCGVGKDATAQLWRVDDGSELVHFDGHRGSLVRGAFHASGDWVATCAHDGTTCIWPTDPVAIARRLLAKNASRAPADPTTDTTPTTANGHANKR